MNWFKKITHIHKWELSHSFTREGYEKDGIPVPPLWRDVEVFKCKCGKTKIRRPYFEGGYFEHILNE